MTIINNYKFPKLKFLGNIIENISPKVYERFLNIHTVCKDRYTKRTMYKKVQTLQLTEIAIETINRCNGSCSFCPVNKHNDPRKLHTMNRDLFYSIISQLYDLEYNNVLSLHCNNEPLMDKRIYDFVKYARSKLPKARIFMSTNGTLLNIESFYKLISSLDLLIIDNYNDKLKLNKNSSIIHETCKHNKDFDNKVWIVLRKENEIMTSRSGQAKNRTQIKSLSSTCIYPFMQMTIRSNGKVNLCCNDALGNETLGDLNNESLIEIWNGHEYHDIRSRLLKSRALIPLCRKCDTLVIP